MSGSPVYIDGRLAGAVALAFGFSKEPIAGIRPIEEMLESASARAFPARSRPERTAQAIRPINFSDTSLTANLPRRDPAGFGAMKLHEIATPVAFTGFPASTIEQFAPELRALGLEPVQALSGGGKQNVPPPATPLQPGSMISVQLMSGDMSVGADGTVTHVDGNRVYAFGHRFLSVGATELPFARSSVIALLPSTNTSFKISSSGAWAGSILDDNSVGVSGELGYRPPMVPLQIAVNGKSSYSMQMVNDPLLSPMLLQMALYGALDATGRTLGVGTINIKGAVEFAGINSPYKWENSYSGDFNVPLQTSLSASLPVAFALQNNTDALKLKSIKLDVQTQAEKRQMHIEDVWASKKQVHPGEQLDIFTLLAGDKGVELTEKVTYKVPIGATVGTLYVTVADGPSANASDYKQLTLTDPKPAPQMISLLNSLRGNTQAYVRLWRSDAAYNIQGEDLPDPPASIGMILSRAAASSSTTSRYSTVAEMAFGANGLAISGSRTIQVEIK